MKEVYKPRVVGYNVVENPRDRLTHEPIHTEEEKQLIEKSLVRRGIIKIEKDKPIQ